MSNLTFSEVSEINLSRASTWHPTGIDDWSVNDWAVAAGGEMGEILDGCKKLKRLESGLHSANPRQPKSHDQAVQDIATEIGDTFLYLDLLAHRLGISLETCIRDTFNRVSIREGFDHRL